VAKGILIAILAAALALRLGWALSRSGDEAALRALPDQVEYLALGRNLLRGDGLQFADERFNGARVYAFRTPGYPLFIAACGGHVVVVRVVQCLIDVSTVLAVYLLARRWLGAGPALLAAAGVTVNPFLVFFCPLILSETLFTAMLAWALAVMVRPRRPNWAMLCGVVLLALSVQVRPEALGLPVVMAIAAMFANPATRTRRALPPALTGVVLTLLVLLPWAMRNRTVLGRWIWLTTNGGITAYDGFNPDADGSSDQSFIAAMPQLKDMTELERDAYLRNQAAAFVRQNPEAAVELAGRKIARTWSPVPLSAQYRTPANLAIALLYSLPLDLLAIYGVLTSAALPRAAKGFLLAPVIYFTLVHALSVGSLRYRVPVEPALAVLAAAGVSALWRREVQFASPAA